MVRRLMAEVSSGVNEEEDVDECCSKRSVTSSVKSSRSGPFTGLDTSEMGALASVAFWAIEGSVLRLDLGGARTTSAGVS